MEVWKSIDGYAYEISNTGLVRSRKSGRLIKPFLRKKDGYKQVHLCNNGKSKTIQLHRLLATYFVEGFKESLQVNHKDGNKLNNSIDNLEWVTARENIRHAYKIGLHKRNPDKMPGAKLSVAQVLEIKRRLANNDFQKEIASDLLITPQAVSLIARGISWAHVY